MEARVPDFTTDSQSPASGSPLTALDPEQLQHPAWSSPTEGSSKSVAIPPTDEATRPSVEFENGPAAPLPPQPDASGWNSSGNATPAIPQSVLESSAPVQPATFTEAVAAVPNQKNPDLQLAKDLVRQYSVAESQQTLPGRPVRLRDLIARVPLEYRKAMVMQYWETAYDWMALQIAREYEAWLNQLNASGRQTEAVLLNAARIDAKNQVLAAEIQLAKSQSRLQELSFDSSDVPPLPADMPLVKAYRTHYQWYYQRRLVPRNLIGIDQVLPKTLELIGQRAEATRVAKSAMNQSGQAATQGQIGLGSALEAARLWQDTTRKLFGSIMHYNQSIADYALSINRTAQSPDQIVSMLIGRPTSGRVEVDDSQSVLNSSYDRPMRTADLRNQPGATNPSLPSRNALRSSPAAGGGFSLSPQPGSHPYGGSQPTVTPATSPTADSAGSGASNNRFQPGRLPSDRPPPVEPTGQSGVSR